MKRGLFNVFLVLVLSFIFMAAPVSYAENEGNVPEGTIVTESMLEISATFDLSAKQKYMNTGENVLKISLTAPDGQIYEFPLSKDNQFTDSFKVPVGIYTLKSDCLDNYGLIVKSVDCDSNGLFEIADEFSFLTLQIEEKPDEGMTAEKEIQMMEESQSVPSSPPVVTGEAVNPSNENPQQKDTFNLLEYRDWLVIIGAIVVATFFLIRWYLRNGGWQGLKRKRDEWR